MLTNLQLTSVSTLYHNWSERDCLVKIIGLVTDFMSNMHYVVGLEDIVSIPKQYTKYVVSYHSVLYNDYYIFEVILDTSTKHLRSSFVPHYYGGSSGWNSGDTAYFWNSFTIQKTSPNGFLLIWFSRYHKHAIPIPSKKRLIRYLRNRLAREVPKLTLLPLGDQYKIVSWTIKDLNRDLPVIFHSYLSEEIGEPGENLSTIGYETLELVYREITRLPLPAEIILLINSEYVKMVKEEFLSRVF